MRWILMKMAVRVKFIFYVFNFIQYVLSLDNFYVIFLFVRSIKEDGSIFFKWRDYVFVFIKYV